MKPPCDWLVRLTPGTRNVPTFAGLPFVIGLGALRKLLRKRADLTRCARRESDRTSARGEDARRATDQTNGRLSVFPVWEDEEDGVCDIDPDTLPISSALKQDLIDWADQLDSSLDWNDPAGTVWPSGFWACFNERGADLAKRLQDELGPEFQVEARLWGGDAM